MIPYVTADNAKKIAQEVKEEDSKIKIHSFKYYTGDNLYVATKEEAEEILRKYCSGYLIMGKYAQDEESEFTDDYGVFVPGYYNKDAEEDDVYLKLFYSDYVGEGGSTVTYTVTADGKLAVSVSDI